MYNFTVYNKDGALLEWAEQEEPVDIEALCKKHDLGYWKRTHRVEKFKMTIWYCYRGRINVKYIKEED